MSVRFSKMHSLGNDFVVIDGVRQSFEMTPALAAHVADRHLGVGCDQLLVARPANGAGGEFAFRIFNSDGSESSQCGNGARCFARFLQREGLSDSREIRVATHNTLMTLTLLEDGRVRVDMGAPVFDPDRVPFIARGDGFVHTLPIGSEPREFAVLSMGNPHAVTLVENIDTADVDGIGKVVERHAQFPERTNVGFMRVIDRGRIALRVFERGVGETRACGSGACAAAVAGQQLNLLDGHVVVELPGGRVEVDWAGGHSPVYLTGDAVHVFDGEIEIT